MLPLGTSYLHADQRKQMEPYYPLHVWVCDACFLVQLPFPVAGDGSGGPITGDCTFFASSAAGRLEHARRYADRAIEEFRLRPVNLVVEVGSNDGYLLQYFVLQNIPVLGIDPAVNVSRAAIARGVPTRNQFFDQRMARALRDEGVTPDLVIVNNVVAEIHDLNDFVAGLKILMAPRGVMTMEFPQVMRLIAENQFDTIQHGRFSYFSLLAATHLLERHGLTVYDVDELDTQGGSLRIFVCHSEDPLRPITPRVDKFMAREREAGVDTLDYYAEFAGRVQEAKGKLVDFLVAARRDGKRIAGYGAHGKSNTLLSYCGIDIDLMDYTVDPDPEKHGRYLAGSHIPIQPPELIEQTRPDYVLLLTWHLQSEIVPQLDYIRAWGGRCVIPIPEVHMVA
jgi:hypothetical protein